MKLFKTRINNPLRKIFFKEDKKEDSNQSSLFYSKKVEKWKKMGSIDKGGPTILCRICEMSIKADKMLVLIYYYYILNRSIQNYA